MHAYVHVCIYGAKDLSSVYCMVAIDHSIMLLSDTSTNTDPAMSTSMISSSAMTSPAMISATYSVEPAATCASFETVVSMVLVTVSSTSTVHVTASQSTMYTSTTTFVSRTVTVTSTVSDTASRCITNITPSNVQCSNQRIDKKSDNSCNAVAICIPVAVVIALVTCVIAVIAVWKLRHKAIYNFVNSNPQMAKVYNDLYGLVALQTFYV